MVRSLIRGVIMLDILKANEKYDDNLTKYNKKDGILALTLFAIVIILYSIVGILYINLNIVKENIKIIGIIFNAILIIITILFAKFNKQKIDTLGLGGRWKLSIIIGVILSLFYFYCNCLSHLIEGEKLIPINNILFLIIYFLFISASEEIVFRGYIGTRLNGLIKNKYIVLFITGILFVVMHFPYRMIVANMSLSDFNIEWLFNLLIFHFVMSFIYMKTNSIIGAIIPHWISDLAYEIVSK